MSNNSGDSEEPQLVTVFDEAEEPELSVMPEPEPDTTTYLEAALPPVTDEKVRRPDAPTITATEQAKLESEFQLAKASDLSSGEAETEPDLSEQKPAESVDPGAQQLIEMAMKVREINMARLRHLAQMGYQIPDTAIMATRLEALISSLAPQHQAQINYIFEVQFKEVLEETEREVQRQRGLQTASSDQLAAFMKNAPKN